MMARAFIGAGRNGREHSGAGYQKAVARALLNLYENAQGNG